MSLLAALLSLVVVALSPAVQSPAPPAPPPILLPQPLSPPPFTCDGTEDPCDPERPWMRGHQEKSCARPDKIEALRAAKPGQVVLECACHHMCDASNKYSSETNRRAWDGACQARCNPKNCTCPNPCDS